MLLSPPTYADYADGKFVVVTPMLYKWGKTIVTVPAGFVTDFASIPRLARLVIPVNARHKRAALLHDYLYSRGGDLGVYTFTRKQADKVFLKFMKELGVGYLRRSVMFRAVRLFGWMHPKWRNRGKESSG